MNVHDGHALASHAVPFLARRAERAAPSHRGLAWRDGLLALLLATGLSSVFLTPVRHSLTTKETLTAPVGRVLGVSVTQPLTVTVVVHWPTAVERVTVQPRSGTLAEVLSLAAQQLQASFTYTSRGESQYLQHFTRRSALAPVVWTVLISGVPVTDLSLVTLRQGDTISLQPLLQ